MVNLKPMQASYPLKRLRTSERHGRGVVRHPFDPHLTLSRAPCPLVEGGGKDARSVPDEERSQANASSLLSLQVLEGP